jgi:hypothetical protein
MTTSTVRTITSALILGEAVGLFSAARAACGLTIGKVVAVNDRYCLGTNYLQEEARVTL